VLLNAIFLDHLHTDLDHLRRLNDLTGANGGLNGYSSAPAQPMRRIVPFSLGPSEDLALVDIGYRDAGERIGEIEAFLFDSGALFPDTPSPSAPGLGTESGLSLTPH
jgi:hypothetical protein